MRRSAVTNLAGDQKIRALSGDASGGATGAEAHRVPPGTPSIARHSEGSCAGRRALHRHAPARSPIRTHLLSDVTRRRPLAGPVSPGGSAGDRASRCAWPWRVSHSLISRVPMLPDNVKTGA